ncbi:MAG: hypothetical protein KC609_26895 [Myxococcales bacterium]|nr:hypothetical protein [Myxococcales bacterium]
MALQPKKMLTLLFALLVVSGCGARSTIDDPGTNPGGKDDSGWIGADTFEVQATVRSTVRQRATGDWSGLAEDKALQLELVDNQLKFIKNSAEALGWRFNQLAESVSVTSVEIDGDEVVIVYSAEVDMLGRLPRDGKVPSLEKLDPKLFSAKVPVAPIAFGYTEIANCSEGEDGHSVASYNFHYYFTPDKEGCTLPLVDAEVEITKVFDRPVTYPEYDLLMQPFDDGTVGFRAALVPNRGDEDPASRFKAHAKELEEGLGLTGETVDDGKIRRYIWKKGNVKIVIDLFDPTKLSWTEDFYANFRAQLKSYTVIHYNGHSAYGTQHLLDDPDAFSDRYQIISMHSCQSYAYYTREVFRAKATESDPSGFALADVVATGKSSYPTGAPPVIATLLDSLMTGMLAIDRGEREKAPDWISIAKQFNYVTYGDIMYGVAGVRTNSWQP